MKHIPNKKVNTKVYISEIIQKVFIFFVIFGGIFFINRLKAFLELKNTYAIGFFGFKLYEILCLFVSVSCLAPEL